jgi:hypothetical protein
MVDHLDTQQVSKYHRGEIEYRGRMNNDEDFFLKKGAFTRGGGYRVCQYASKKGVEED